MATSFRRAPAITPDARHHGGAAPFSAAVAPPRSLSTSAVRNNNNNRAVSFGFGTLKTPTAAASSHSTGAVATTTARDAREGENGGSAATVVGNARRSDNDYREETLRQYSLYRSAPDRFPAYERLRFVRLPEDWLPADLQVSSSSRSSSSISGNLSYWPALVYQNLAELVRDLSPAEPKVLKAKLILEHRKCPRAVVARLMRWNSRSSSILSESNDNNGSMLFEEKKLELVRLSGSSIEENEDPANGYSGELTSFVDSQLEFETVCDEILARRSSDVDEEVTKHALRFRTAVDMALNVLALDVGADPLPPRGDDEGVVATTAVASAPPTLSDEVAAAVMAPSREGPRSAAELKKSVLDGEKPVKMKSDTGATKRNPAKDNAAMKNEGKRRSSKSPFSKEAGTAAGDKENCGNAAAREVRKSSSSYNVSKGKGLAVRSPTPKRFQDLAMKKSGMVVSNKSPTYHSSKTKREVELMAAKSRSHERFLDLAIKNKKTNMKHASSSSQLAATTASVGGSRPARLGSKSGSSSAQTFVFEDKPELTNQSTEAANATGDHAATKAASTEDAHEKAKEAEVEAVPWKDVWAAMKRFGWTWRGGSGLMTDYYYIKPGCKISDSVEGRDYFISVNEAQEYARCVFGWENTGVSRAMIMERIEEHATHAGEMIPPLGDGIEVYPNEGWRAVWDKLLASGWTWKAGSGLMMDYYYVKPGRSIRDGTEGKDYFVRRKDVEGFANRNYGWRGEVGVMAMRDTVKALEEEDERGERRRSRSSGEHQASEKRPKVESMRNSAVRKLAATRTEKTKNQTPQEDAQGIESKEPGDYDRGDDEEQSTFSQSGFQSNKTLFLEECADSKVPPLNRPILPDEPWRDVWQKMLNSGWTWRVGTGLMTDYYYIKPGLTRIKEGTERVDYFTSKEEVQGFAMRNYGWRGVGETGGRTSSGGESGGKKRHSSFEERENQQKKRHKVERARQYQTLKKANTPRVAVSPTPRAIGDLCNKKAAWQMLQKEGWKVISAGRFNKLHDWYYLQPGCDPGNGSSELGVDYFLSEEDAIDHYLKEKCSSGKKKRSSSGGRTAKGATAVGVSLQTPDGCRTKPQDPAVPLLSSPRESSPSSSDRDYYEWTNLWPVLQRAGWKAIKAARYNPLHDWYYVRPDRDLGDRSSELGRHYFAQPDDVIEFVRRLDDEEGRKCSGKARGQKRSQSGRKSIGVMLGAFEEEARKS